MRMPQFAAATLAALSLAGCATYSWQHPSKTQADFKRDNYACIQESAHAFPAIVRRETYGSGYTTPAKTNCTTNAGQTSCTTTPAVYHPPTVRNVDVNEDNRKRAFDACMQAGGWTLVEDRPAR